MKIRAIVVSALIISSIFAAIIYIKAAQSPNGSKQITEALQSRNTPILIKGLISKMKEQTEVNNDDFPALIKEVETYTAQCPDTAAVAVLHSMTAEMYNHFYLQNQWKINQRTALSGFVPEDIREWSGNLFTNKIKDELAASLKPAKLLQNTPASAFKAIMETGKDSPALRPTLFDFLAFRALNIQPSTEIYLELLGYLNLQQDKKAALLTELDYLQYKYATLSSAKIRTQYISALDSLLHIYNDKDYSVEILSAQINILGIGNRGGASEDSINAAEYAICKSGIARYPNYDRIGILKERLNMLVNPTLVVQTDNNVYPGKSLTLKLNYKNIPHITVSIFKSLRTPQETLEFYASSKQKVTWGGLVKKVEFALPVSTPYSRQDTILSIPMDELGLYECSVSSEGRQIITNNLFSVSRLASLSRNLPYGKTEILVTDFESGKPISEASILYYGGQRRNLQRLGSIKTDKEGLATFPPEAKVQAYKATCPGDTSSLLTNIYPVGSGKTKIKDLTEVSLFSDRGIYRPGQTIYFKGIAYNNTISNPHVAEGESFTVTLRDANNKEVATKQMKTNKFGSFNGEFTIPQQTLSGTFTLSTSRATAYIQVEEYKRPTFMVDILPIKSDIAFGDQVSIEGKAQTFSGVSLQSGNINYRIARRPLWLRGYSGGYSTGPSEEQVAEGSTTVSSNGTFSFDFRPEKVNGDSGLLPYQTYTVSVNLTDSKGETEEASYSFSVGEVSIVLFTNLLPMMEKDSVNAIVTARTLNGEKTSVSGNFSIYKLADTSKEGQYNEDRQAVNGTFATDLAIDKEIFAKLPAGRYRIKLEAKDTKGRKVTDQKDFILYSKRDKRPPVFTHIWLLQEKTTCLPGEEGKIIFGTSDKDAHILYELFSGGKCVLQKRIELSDENRTFHIPFLESYGEGVVALFTFVKERKLYTTEVPIKHEEPNRLLTIKPETFRDHLLPGSKETWKFRITDADSVPVAAEVLASMYDASLDKIVPFSWYFSPRRSIYLNAPQFTGGNSFSDNNQYSSATPKNIKIPMFLYDRLNWQGMMDYQRYRSYNGAMMMKSSAPLIMAESLRAGKDVSDEAVITGYGNLEEPAITGNSEREESTAVNNEATSLQLPVQLRENFNETAFFYPSLLTDQEGNVIIQFTLPESNTTWKFQALANTADLKYGMITKEVVSSKPLMVLPNLPRFMRQGDNVSISTQVINQSDVTITGRVRLELFDPATDQPIVCLTKSQKPFTLSADSTTSVSWTFSVPTTINLIGCRIVADSDMGSDGEQHLIPVLSNQILITESTPFYLIGEGEQRIQLPENKNNASRTPFSMTLELTANPIWYAVQALPTLTQPENDNIISWFASYYSNTLANYIAIANPRIQKVISQWKAQGGTASTLYSNLQKNEELKNILLQETPWVLAAESEAEQKQRLSLLFDLNRATQQREAALQQLLQQQDEEGGWSWFKGLPPSREMTSYILKGMAQLTELNSVEYGEQEKRMQIKALNFLDQQIQQDYENLQKYNKNWKKTSPSDQQLEYLFVRSSYRDIPELGSAREAIRFYTAQAEKSWDKQSLYGKGEIALLMYRNGNKQVAGTILSWLRKTATTSAEKGMYWANNRREANYFTSPIDTHCLLMTVFSQLSPDQKDTDRMKQWLLNQKRTQNWESVPSTVNAIYALLLTGSNWLSTNNACIVEWGNHTYNTNQGETATGYIKETIRGKEITPDMDNITVKKEGTTPAWGAVYNQYFESISQVGQQKGVLNVEKKLFTETNSGSGLQLQPITPGQPLRVGDKVVVRLIVRTDREMDYVFLKDLRAGCFEPTSQLSGSVYRDDVWYYQSPMDVSENFFFSRLPEGTFVLEYAVYVSRTGEYASGISTIQCLYAPEFVSHTEGSEIVVKE